MTSLPCRTADPELWFTERANPKARRLCASCPERAACLRMAVETKAEYGMFGGLTAAERRPLMKGARA